MKSAQGVLSYAEEAFLSLTKSRKGFSRKWWSRWELNPRPKEIHLPNLHV